MKTWNPPPFLPCARCATLRPSSLLEGGICLDGFCTHAKKDESGRASRLDGGRRRRLLIVDVQEDESTGRASSV